jgi:hypothetical protein
MAQILVDVILYQEIKTKVAEIVQHHWQQSELFSSWTIIHQMSSLSNAKRWEIHKRVNRILQVLGTRDQNEMGVAVSQRHILFRGHVISYIITRIAVGNETYRYWLRVPIKPQYIKWAIEQLRPHWSPERHQEAFLYMRNELLGHNPDEMIHKSAASQLEYQQLVDPLALTWILSVLLSRGYHGQNLSSSSSVSSVVGVSN